MSSFDWSYGPLRRGGAETRRAKVVSNVADLHVRQPTVATSSINPEISAPPRLRGPWVEKVNVGDVMPDRVAQRSGVVWAAVACATVAVALVAGSTVAAQGRGGAARPPVVPRAAAPVDLTGYWVSVISEDWAWRMFTPPKGDYASMPLNPEGTRVANLWTPEQDGSCKAYGAAGVMRMPTRVHITWENDTTLKVETDAGRQTRVLQFSAPGTAPAVAGPRTVQGRSTAEWLVSGAVASSGADGGANLNAARRSPWGSLKVVTTNMLAGWLRRNGVPYSENAVMTEYFDRFTDEQDEWFTVTTIVEDPTYLTQSLMVSSNFKREADGAKWNPQPCKAGV